MYLEQVTCNDSLLHVGLTALLPMISQLWWFSIQFKSIRIAIFLASLTKRWGCQMEVKVKLSAVSGTVGLTVEKLPIATTPQVTILACFSTCS